MQQKTSVGDGWIGKSPSRVDGPAKVAGTAQYIADVRLANAMEAAVIRSDVPRGRILGIDFDSSFDWSDVVIVTAKDVQPNEVAVIQLDQPVLASSEIRHVYEPIVLLACADREKLERAKQHVHVRVEPLPAVMSIEQSLACESVLYGSDNVMCHYQVKRGEALEAMQGCDVVVRGTYFVGAQEHLYIEPQGVIAYWDDAGVHVLGSIQCPYYVHKALKHALGLEGDRVDVTQSVTGGAFGGKEDYPSLIAVHAALLARKAGRPVRLLYDRKEDIETTTKRHPARVEVVSGCDKSGRLRALHMQVVMDAGAYVTLTPVVLSRGTLHAFGAYEWEHVLIEAKAVATNTPPNGAFRGFGAPQTIFAVERQLDKMAAALGIDPLELRKKNALQIGSTMATGQVIRSSMGLQECIRIAETESQYAHKRKTLGLANKRSNIVRGIGAAVFMHGAGFTGSGEARMKGRIAVDLLPGGKLCVRSSSTEMGQGTQTIFRQIAADAAGVDMADVDVVMPSTPKVPDSGPTVASRTVMIVGSILHQAARGIGERVQQEMKARGGSFSEAADRLCAAEGKLTVMRQYEPPPGVVFDDETYTGTAYGAYAWAVDIAEVEVDLDTFEVSVVGFWSSVDVGRAIHPLMCVGQLDGGALQAIGWALSEEMLWSNGRIINPRMTSYIVPTAKDAPPFFTSLVEEPYEHGPAGAKGIGELPMDGGAPAVAAAIEHATGLSFDRLPITPERLYDAWCKRNDREVS